MRGLSQAALKEDGVKRLGYRLVGKLLSTKLVNRVVFMTMILKIWRTVDNVEIEAIAGTTFSFTFKSAEDQRQVLKGGPWSFDKVLLVVEKPIGKGDIQTMRFNKVTFWVQIHRVPLLCMTIEIGQFLGSMIGDVQEIGVGKYISVRVVVDVTVPLRRIL
ncbi:hypothetical protein Ddye_015637 [Dipteronia dyeriana]|uniref:DUF4283 domain-containing protein n=1 Tax=Dipteronia dyeriana TaxID=168575 RepID=A0AAD9U5Y3_9ROSI|nr:hypothetical protein Ddye_015637 [Dipteronia dyeriana]